LLPNALVKFGSVNLGYINKKGYKKVLQI